MPLKSWSWKYQGHDIRAEVWWRLFGWRRERVYIDHNLYAQWRGYSVRSPGLRCSVMNDSGKEDQIEVRFRRPLWIRSPAFQVAAGLLTCQVLVDDVPWQWESDHVHLQRIWINGEGDEGFPAGVELGIGWGCIIFPLLFVYGVFFFPILVCLISMIEYVRELRLKRRLRRRGRMLDWGNAKRRMSEGPGTLIVEKPFLGNIHVWWTEEDVLARSPFPPTQEHEFWFPGGGTKNPFREWCYYHYQSDDTGKALLIQAPSGEIQRVFSHWLGGPSSKKSPPGWKAANPNLQVVVTGFGPYSKKTAEAFALAMAEGGDDSVPRLAVILRGKDRHLRRLAMNALRMMGLMAHEAIPALIEQLYYGPVWDRIDVANALAAIGTRAIELLKDASKHDDPWIRCPATCALGELELACGSPQSLVRQFQKRLLSRHRFFFLFMQHLNKENVAEVLASMPANCLKVIKTEVKTPGLEIFWRQKDRKRLKAVQEYLKNDP